MSIEDRILEVKRILDEIDILPRAKPTGLLQQARAFAFQANVREGSISLVHQAPMLIEELRRGFGLREKADDYESVIAALASEIDREL